MLEVGTEVAAALGPEEDEVAAESAVLDVAELESAALEVILVAEPVEPAAEEGGDCDAGSNAIFMPLEMQCE